MPLPATLSTALKEWAIVCRALETGRQIILLRKGGIYESGGEFELEHRRFALFPTFLHQKPEMLKPPSRAAVRPQAAEPQRITIASAAEVTDIVQLRSRAQMDALTDAHIWAPPLIDMRFSYRPENPLYLLILRAYLLDQPLTIDNTPAYAGCKSWVPLSQPIACAAATPALEDDHFAAARTGILEKLAATQSTCE